MEDGGGGFTGSLGSAFTLTVIRSVTTEAASAFVSRSDSVERSHALTHRANVFLSDASESSEPHTPAELQSCCVSNSHGLENATRLPQLFTVDLPSTDRWLDVHVHALFCSLFIARPFQACVCLVPSRNPQEPPPLPPIPCN